MLSIILIKFIISSYQTGVEIEEILKLASIDGNEIAPIVQHLYSYAPIDQECTDYKILELDNHLLQALESGERFVIHIIEI